ncbi:MAG: dTDP-4-dehydrorhamnose reductase [Methanomassiliicoccales archaeon]|nr:dTDP-4-dehydrorhamnose reductase [Methanomassiliicoccales archaeon]
MRRVLIVGGSGLLGQYLVLEARSRGMEVLGTHNETTPVEVSRRIDITTLSSVDSIIDDFDPEIIVLSAAMTNVDQCEREPDRAYAVNMEGSLNVASACKRTGAKLVYVSTDYVFNGMKQGRYHEFDAPDPLGVYARSKLEGERVTMDASQDNLVCRVSVVYGWNRVGKKDNFITWIVRSLKDGQAIRLYRDQWVSPTFAPAAAKDILELAMKGARGTYHTSGPDCLNRYDIGLMVADMFGLDEKLITPVNTEDMPLLAARPARSCLSVDKVEAELGRSMMGLRQGLEEMRKELPN